MKGGGDYCGIGLVELVWKAAAVILDRSFTTSITYQYSLRGFRTGRGMGAATLEVKLLHQVVAISEAVLHAIFLDLHKAHNALDRSRCLEILEGYDVVFRDLCLFFRYW